MRSAALAVATSVLALAAAPAALGAERCVGSDPGCFATIQTAVDAAGNGDDVVLGAGTFAGGVTITKSIDLVGAGAGRTTIRGGGPVITVGAWLGAGRPTVRIQGVKITGGRTSAIPTVDFDAQGGGVLISPTAGFQRGGTVTISDSVITGNRVAPRAALEQREGPGIPQCPGGPCPFAGAEGGGIASWGTLTLVGTTVKDNEVSGALTSDAIGGGIWSDLGVLTLTRTTVSGNTALGSPPNGRFAEGGGVFLRRGRLVVRDAAITNNLASLFTTFPAFAGDVFIETNANGGGLHVNDGVPAVIDRTTISGNAVKAVGTIGEPVGFDSAVFMGDAPLTLRDSLISGNRVLVQSQSSHNTGAGGNVMEVDGGGTILRTRFVGNSAVTRSASGDAGVLGGLGVFNFSDPRHPNRLLRIVDSEISGNTVLSDGHAGSFAFGGGLINNSALIVQRVLVSGNSASATGGPGTLVQGGGIFNGPALIEPPVSLRLVDSRVTGNVVDGGPGITASGGGLFNAAGIPGVALTLTRSPITGNRPDDCDGCAAPAPAVAIAAAKSPAAALRPRGGARLR